MKRIAADVERIKAELNSHWEVVAEGAQTILRAIGKPDTYESLKGQKRGRVVTESVYWVWCEAVDVDEKT